MEYQKLNRKALGCMAVTVVLTSIILAGIVFVVYRMIPEGLILVRRIVLGGTVFIISADLFSPFIRYQRYRYRINEESIDVKEGYVFIERTIVPMERLHKISVQSGPISRIFGLSKVVVTTAGGDVEVQFLENETADQIADTLKRRINKLVHHTKEEACELEKHSEVLHGE